MTGGPWADRLIDAPLVTALLQATIGPDYHFCHSAMNIAPRGVGRLGFHQDHHHWRHENPVNLAETGQVVHPDTLLSQWVHTGRQKPLSYSGEPSGSTNGGCYAGKDACGRI